jgi:hypothetical protein
LPGAVKRGSRAPDVDRRPARAAPPPPPRPIPQADPVELRERVRRGNTIAEIAAEFGVPWATARGWLRHRV